MEKITVSELATECSVKNQVVLGELKRLGLYVFSPTATIDASFADTIRKKILAQREAEEAKAAEAEKKKEAQAEQAKKKTAKRAPKAAAKTKAEPKPKKAAAKDKKKEAKPKKEAKKEEGAPKAKKTKKAAAPARPRKAPRKAKAKEEAKPAEEMQPKPSLKPRKGRKHYDRTTNELVEVVAKDPEETAKPTPEEMAPAAAAETPVTVEEIVPEAPATEATSPEPAGEPPAIEVPTEETTPVPAEAAAPEAPAAQPATTRKMMVPKAKTRVLMRTSTEKVVTPEVSNRLFRGIRDDRAVGSRSMPPPRTMRRKKGPRPEPSPSRAAEIPQPPLSPEDFKPIAITEGVTLKELADKMDIKSKYIIQKLMAKGILASINQALDVEAAKEVCAEFGFNADVISFEQEVEARQEVADDPGDIVTRAPVVTVMGHVDHGKTSLLDAIREANVTESEAGGITQHIGAYHVDINDRSVVFLDTPGHEAFTLMRARGAEVTDIVVLVVAADDGVMPQTVEAIHHAKAANVPILVAINKIDKPDAQPDRVKQALSDQGLVAEDWGGDIVMVPVSAKARTNLDLLLEMILLVADLKDLKANPKRLASGVVLEAKVDTGRGRVATVLVQNGSLRVGDAMLAGAVSGRVRALLNDRGEDIQMAGPSTPAEIQGLQDLPQAGDIFQVFDDPSKARQVAEYRQQKVRETSLRKTSRFNLEALFDQLSEGEVKELPLILRADVQGSAEVLSDVLNKLSTDKVKVNILHSGAGAVTETDVLLASASNAIIIAFNVRPERKAQDLADAEGVEIRAYTVIYNVSKDIKNAMIGMLDKTSHEKYLGRAEVRDTFKVPKLGSIAGSYILDGIMKRNADIRLLRDNVVVHEGKIVSLRRFKDDVTEVRSGFECGIGFESFSDIKVGDIIEAYTIEKVQPTSL